MALTTSLHTTVAAPTVTEFPIPPNPLSTAGPILLYDIVAGADGNLWVSENGQHGGPSLDSISPAGTGFTRFPLTLGLPGGVGLGADGNVYVTDQASNKIARVTPLGAQTLATYASSAGTQYISPGLDGLMWFGECNSSGVVGSVSSTATTSVEYTMGNGNNIYATTIGPDGAIWFTDSFNSTIGRISGTVVADFPTTPTLLPGSVYPIATGSDGNLWVAGYGFISKIDPATGTYQNYPNNPNASFLIPGPDGALWYTLSGSPTNGSINRISTAGTTTSYPVSGSPNGLTVGPDGNIWFTLNSTAKVGKLAI